jgi:predicted enzyme involved in methoxymalonyl-ACP biosynthesis
LPEWHPSRFPERIDGAHNFYFLNAQKWIESAGKNAFSPKLWYMAKVPYGQEVFAQATRDIKTVLRSIMGLSRKIIILDLDDTLWGGSVGEVGWKIFSWVDMTPSEKRSSIFRKS